MEPDANSMAAATSALTIVISFIKQHAEGVTAAASFLAVIFSLFAIWVTRRMQLRLRSQEGAATALVEFANLERMIKDVPEALEFHGITDQELELAGISAGQLSYFLSNITTGGIYYRTTEGKELIRFFGEDGYYGQTLKHIVSRNAWAICRCCIAPSKYREQLDALSKAHGGPSVELAEYIDKRNR